jgi:uncharacterized protein (TIGR02597 family)
MGQTTVTTDPVGVMTYSFPATTQLTSYNFSVPLTNAPIYAGAVASFTSTTVTFADTPFTADALAQSGSPYFLRFQSGTEVGRCVLVTANTANSVTVDVTNNSSQTTNLDTSGFSVAAGDLVQIFQGDTLASFFGDNTTGNPLIIVGAAAPLSADTVSIYNKRMAKQDGYYFSTTLGYWRSNATTENKNGVVLYPDAAIGLTRRAGRTALSFTVLGDVPAVAPKIKTIGSNQFIFGVNPYPVDMTLASLNLSNWTKSNSALSADTVGIYNSAQSKMDAYFQKLDGTWRKVGDTITDQSSLPIPAGSSLGFLKRAAVSGTTSFLSSSLPYTP